MIRLHAFDLETTGVDVETDRIVTASLVTLDPTGIVEHAETWLLNPEVDIPAGATAVHGITTERARTEGMPARQGLSLIVGALARTLWHDDGETPRGEPLVIYNAPFDLTLLDREYRRTFGLGLEETVDVTDTAGVIAHPLWAASAVPIIDPLVLDKQYDRYRAGRRTLAAVCAVHGITLTDAHTSAGDAAAAGMLAQAMLNTAPLAGAHEHLPALHDAQARWARAQADSFADYLRSRGQIDDAARVSGDWPTRPHTYGDTVPTGDAS